jgi:hypothetical protein
MGRPASLSVELAWNSVALEERLELISRANAEGLIAGATFVALMGSVAYGFDEIWILFGSFGGAFLFTPLFASYCWRRTKPELILKYLSVRSVARRYAYGVGLSDLEIILIFRTMLEERYENAGQEVILRSEERIDFDSNTSARKREVWVVLMRGAVVALSERQGGAKLEFISALSNECKVQKNPIPDSDDDFEVLLTGTTGQSKGKRLAFSGMYKGALYVFERQLSRLIYEAEEEKTALLERLSHLEDED